MKPVIVHSKKRVFDGFLKIDEAEVSYELRSGAMSPRVKRLNMERGDAAAVIIHNPQRRSVLLVRQFKYPTYEKGAGWLIEAAAGMIDRGEEPAAAARREVFEESGYSVHELELIAKFYVTPGGSSERIYLYYAAVRGEDKTGPGGGLAEEHEDIELLEFPESDIDRLLREVEDAKTLIGLYWLRQKIQTEGQKHS